MQVYEIGDCDGLPFFSLEYCAGGSLAERLHGTPVAPELAARTIVKLARAMHYAHGCRVVHRDLKPGNILLHPKDDSGRPAETAIAHEPFDFESVIFKISDFGLAKRLDEDSQTKTGAVLGTPSYMAPEQASGKIHEVGPLADIYALGAILYELLTGRPPFRAATALDTVVQVIHDEPVPPRRLQPSVPVDLETIALKCLEKDPLKRYSSAAATRRRRRAIPRWRAYPRSTDRVFRTGLAPVSAQPDRIRPDDARGSFARHRHGGLTLLRASGP